jgi:hypothetical protein
VRIAAVGTAVVAAILAVGAASATGAQPDRVKLCSPAEVRSTVDRFVAAFNAGDARRLDRIFSRRPYFRWYTTDAPGERFLPSAAHRGSLLPYFAQRHALGERLTLRSLRVNGNTVASGAGWKTYGNFQYTLVREATDLPATNYGGKGSLHCHRTTPDVIFVWSMSRHD